MRHDEAALARPGRRPGVALPFDKLLKDQMFLRGGLGVVEVAKAAGVHHSTVSRALRGAPAKFDTQVRILEALRAFEEDPRAKALLNGEVPWSDEEEG